MHSVKGNPRFHHGEELLAEYIIGFPRYPSCHFKKKKGGKKCVFINMHTGIFISSPPRFHIAFSFFAFKTAILTRFLKKLKITVLLLTKTENSKGHLPISRDKRNWMGIMIPISFLQLLICQSFSSSSMVGFQDSWTLSTQFKTRNPRKSCRVT